METQQNIFYNDPTVLFSTHDQFVILNRFSAYRGKKGLGFNISNFISPWLQTNNYKVFNQILVPSANLNQILF